jgi:hypothetical protein
MLVNVMISTVRGESGGGAVGGTSVGDGVLAAGTEAAGVGAAVEAVEVAGPGVPTPEVDKGPSATVPSGLEDRGGFVAPGDADSRAPREANTAGDTGGTLGEDVAPAEPGVPPGEITARATITVITMSPASLSTRGSRRMSCQRELTRHASPK